MQINNESTIEQNETKEDSVSLQQDEVIKEKIANTQFSPFFIKNEGQAPREIYYYYHGKDQAIYFTAEGIVFQSLYPFQSDTTASEEKFEQKKEMNSIREVTYLMRLVNQNKHTKIIGVDPQKTQLNFFKGNNQQTTVSTYDRIVYQDVYPHIDIEFLFQNGVVKYNLMVYPGGDPRRVEFQFDGLSSIRLDQSGNAVLTTSAEEFTQLAPVTFQEIDGKKIIVPSTYHIDEEKKLLSFVIDEYDASQILIVDPVLSTLSAATFFGAAGTSITGIDSDSSGNIYIAGSTSNASFPTSAGAYDVTYTGSTDGFITKMTSDLTTIQASTFLSGTGDAEVTIRDVLLDASNNVFVVGDTGSISFPTTTGAYDVNKNGGVESSDVFISKLSSNLDSLSASTYLGGSDSDTAIAFSSDTEGNIYVFGSTGDNFPTTVGAYDETPNDLIDFFIAKMSNNLQSLSASTFFDIGNFFDYATGIKLDSAGNVFVFGATSDASFITTAGAYDTSYNGGNDGYISKFSSNLQSLLAATYLGGTGDDYIKSISFDSNNNLYVVGEGNSSDFPTTAGTYNTIANGSDDIYISKLSANLQSLLSSTFLGSTGSESASGIGLDANENLYIFGTTDSANFPTTTGAYDTGFNGVSDVVVSKFNSSLASLLGSTYIGGSNVDSVIADILFYDNDVFVLAGSTLSSNFPTTIGAYDTTYGGILFSSDGVIMKLASVNTPPTLTTSTPSQTTASIVTVSTTLTDTDNDITSLIVEHSTNGTSWTSSTLSTVTPSEGAVTTATGQISGIDTDLDGSVQLTILWNIGVDLPNTDTSTVYLRFTPNDGTENGTVATTSVFAIDTADPSVPGNLSVATLNSSTISFTFPSVTSTDTNFLEYKIHYSTTTPVTSSTSAFTSSTDASLGNSNFTGESASAAFSVSILTPNTVYYFNLFAYDTWSHSTSSVLEVSTTTYAKLPSALSSSGITQTAATITWLVNNNPVGTEFYAENSANSSMNSGWITTSTSTFSSLTCGTAYSFRVKARNSVEVASDWSEELSVSTSACDQQGGGGIAPAPAPTPPAPDTAPADSTEECDLATDPECVCNPYTQVCTQEDFLPKNKLITISDPKKTSAQTIYFNTHALLIGFDTTYADTVSYFESNQPSTNFEDQSYTPNTNLFVSHTFSSGDGKKCINAKFRNTQGQIYEYATYLCILIDTLPPQAPTITNFVSGVTNTGKVTGLPFIFGTAEPGAKIIIHKNVTQLAATTNPQVGQKPQIFLAQDTTYYSTTDSQGNWKYIFPSSLPKGTYTFTISVQDKSGNTSPALTYEATISQSPILIPQENPDPKCVRDSCAEDDPCAGGLCEEPEPKSVCIGEECAEPEPVCVGDDCIEEGTDLIQDLDTNTQEQTETKTDGKTTEQFTTKISSSTRIEKMNTEVSSTTIDVITERANIFITKATQALSPISKKLMTLAQDPQVERINETALAPTVLIATAANVATSFGLGQLLIYLRYLFTQPLTLLGMRKRKKWGVVYNGFTKQPIDLALVRLLDAQTGKVKETQVTDMQGRYVFVGEPGTYTLEISKKGFVGYSRHLKDIKQDSTFSDLYHGEEIELSEEKNTIAFNIPLDPDGTIIPAEKLLKTHHKKIIQSSISSISVLIAIVSVIISPTPIVLIFLALHLIVYIIFHYIATQKIGKNFGTIFHAEDKQKILKNTIIRIFDAQYNRLIDTKISNNKGRYAALVGSGNYIVTYEKPEFETKKNTISINHAGGVIARDEELTELHETR